MICAKCGAAILLQYPDGTGPCCFVVGKPYKKPRAKSAPKPKKRKTGRRITKTLEERKAVEKLWHKNNPRREYQRDNQRRLNGVIVGHYVVELNGKWKRRTSNNGSGSQWGTFSLSHTYSTIGFANMAVKYMGKGTVMERMETEEMTVANWKESK